MGISQSSPSASTAAEVDIELPGKEKQLFSGEGAGPTSPGGLRSSKWGKPWSRNERLEGRNSPVETGDR